MPQPLTADASLLLICGDSELFSHSSEWALIAMPHGPIRLIEPEFPVISEIGEFLDASFRDRYFSNFGPNVRALEQELAAYLGIGREVVTVSSATAGLTAVLLAIEVKGLVAIPAYTFAATASAVYQAGCEPYPIDVDADSWEMNLEYLEWMLDRQPIAAVVHVRPFGLCRSLTPLSQRIADRGIPLIIDSAAAFGGLEPNGQMVGGCGIAEVFSFHATKPFGIGEGGAVAASAKLAQRIRSATNFNLAGRGADTRWGLNGKMSEFHAAVGRAVLRKFPERLTLRRSQAEAWRTALQRAGTQLPTSPGMPPWQVFPVRLPGNAASEVKAELATMQIESRIYYQPALSAPKMPAPPIAHALSQQVLCLPVGMQVSGDVIEQVANVIKTHVGPREAAQAIPGNG